MKKCRVLGYLLVLLMASQGWSQLIPDTLKVPVTYYDFHSNGSNPEFEKDPGGGAGTHLGMVANALHLPDRKPALGPTPYWDCYIAKWFVKWQPNDFTIPNYTTPAKTDCSNGILTVSYDTAFKDTVIQDTLKFVIQNRATGTYQYYNPAFFPLDNRGFGAEGQIHNYSFSMELHWKFTKKANLTFAFEGDDDVWAFINNRLAMDIGGIHNTTAGSLNVDTLGLANDSTYMLDFFYCERHRTGSDIRITTNIISAPPAKIKMTRVPNTKSIPTGDSIRYTASVLDDTNGVRNDLSSLITWSEAPLIPASLLPGFSPVSKLASAGPGNTNTFYGGQAYRSYVITSTLVDPSNATNILHSYDTVYVTPAADYRVVIEADTIIDTFAPARLALMTMDGSTNKDTAYAIVRDRFGQYSRLANNAVWTSRNTALATVVAGPPKYVGIVSRVPLQNGTDTIQAIETALLPDSVQLVLQNGKVDSLRLVNSVTGDIITGISMNTDSSVSVKIQVIWSSDPTKTWVDGTGSWALKPDTIAWDANPPAMGGTWNISPKTPGVENLTVTSGSVSKTVPLTITPADPSKVNITLITPLDSCIAGKPIKIAVQIQNTDGLEPGNWCTTSATYTDALGNGNKSVQPTININGVLVPVSLGQQSNECFNNGLDTITVTLYNAPASIDSNHTISLVLFNKHINLPITSTVPFHLLPGPLDSLALQDQKHVQVANPDTLVYPSGSAFIYSVGFDQWGNLIGNISSSWSKTGILPSFTPPAGTQQNIYFDASNSVLSENGIITASAPSGVNPGTDVTASVQVAIIPRGANLSSAITKDLNGNGYLDQIWVTLDKPVTASINSQIPSSNVSVVYTDPNTSAKTTLAVDSIRPVSAVNDSTSSFVIYLTDNNISQNGILEPTSAIPQTSWRPLISISGIAGANTITNKQCKDGAGPVIWSVVVDKTDPTNRSSDLVTITFSEPIQDTDGSEFSIGNLPSLVFNVWKKNGNGLQLDTTVLACDTVKKTCIDGFIKPSGTNASVVQFTMGNGKTIFDYDYFSIRVPFKITDKASSAGPGNWPDTVNQRVVAQIHGNPITMQVGPNPTHPTYSKPSSPSGYTNNSSYSVIDFVNNTDAPQFAHDHGGAVFQFTVSPGDSGQGRVTAYIKIYDVVGNLVNSAHKDGPHDNLVSEIKGLIGSGPTLDTSASYNYDVYWDGVNAKGMKVSTGVYQAFAYLTTYDRNGAMIKQSRQQAVLGMRR